MLDHVESHILGLNHIKSEIVNGQIRILQILSRHLSNPIYIFLGPQPTETGTLRLSTKPMVVSRQRENAWPATLHCCTPQDPTDVPELGLCHAKWVSPLTSFFREDPPQEQCLGSFGLVSYDNWVISVKCPLNRVWDGLVDECIQQSRWKNGEVTSGLLNKATR